MRGVLPLRTPHVPLADLVRRRARPPPQANGGAPDALQDLAGFGPDPGQLRMRAFIPPGLRPGAGLLVALHGCSQTAAGFDHGCGWSDLAAAHGFALLLPEQRRENNPGNCFSWFEPGDTTRGRGEVESIRAAVAHLVAAHGLDGGRVAVTGLSAGGAMAASLLATHPDVFAAGAIIAGLPHGAASGVQEAFEAMTGGRARDAETWAGLVRAAAPAGTTRWPRVAIWHGEADGTVRPGNARELTKQWAALHGLDPARPAREEPLPRPGAGLRRVWLDPQGEAVLELTLLPGLDHGVPISPGDGVGQGGRTMPFILDAGIAGPADIVAFCGLAPATRPQGAGVIAVGTDGIARRAVPTTARHEPEVEAEAETMAPGLLAQPGEAIRRALRAAGLLR